ncbi:protein of unknown function DUF3444 [Dillenia turbinata]|uniref:DUF3444 domain-containing protein n=1 Tax=Dillenia turbinata TaxID=194707 RepID=A0AAN8Z166_9MAGN
MRSDQIFGCVFSCGPNIKIAPGFSKTSGIFWVGKHAINKSINLFPWTRGTRNWSPDWNELTLDEVIQKYDMVEVLEDYNETQGVTIAPLVNVPGFKIVFRQHLDFGKLTTMPREMIQFSPLQ